ncbi:MAG: GDSL-type esterase/lipase family protein [Planctomycetota bacterium]|nr:GDSL-type esterase/lipase family protein [Planctomycetota bacterium]
MDSGPKTASPKPGSPGASPWTLGGLFRFGLTAFQFGLLVLVVRAFQLESRAFLQVMVLAWGGFVVTHFLPGAARMPLFAGLSVASVLVVLDLEAGSWLLGLGVLLIGAAHAPIAHGARVALMLALGAGLALLRTGVVDAPWPSALWPILGSMFMFRAMIYLYDLRHKSAPFNVWNALGYFFMLPNVCFPLFPVVDYKTFCRSHDNDESWLIHQKGLRWMLRGVVHLLIYRAIYQNFILDPAKVAGGLDAVRVIFSTYLLYFRVSGAFHLIAGLLHMFGFNLPETFHLWLLSNNFTDFWRRINVYWKNFMQKVFFTPVHFMLRRRVSPTTAVVLATLVTFVATWFLHGYQWFWIRGSFPTSWQDAIFWSLLGLMITINVYWETKHGRARALGKVRRTLGSEVAIALRTIAMFLTITFLWSMWTAGSWAEWGLVLDYLGELTILEGLGVVGALAVLGVAGSLWGRTAPVAVVAGGLARQEAAKPTYWRSNALVCVSCGLLLTVGRSPLWFSFEPRLAEAVERLATNKLNSADAGQLERGYYEDLTDVTRFNSELADLYKDRPAGWNVNAAIRQTPDSYPPYDLYPSVEVEYKGCTLVTNRWGFRDREYEKEKPPGVFRIGFLGSSHTAGIGVENEETYENVLEDRLNAEQAREGLRFEVLNFAISGYGPLCRLATLETRALEFDLDLVVNVGIDDLPWITKELAHAVDKEIGVPYPELLELMAEVDVHPGLPRIVADNRLPRIAERALGWIYARAAAVCAENGVATVATFIPRPETGVARPEHLAAQLELARAGGYTVVDTAHAYASEENLPSLWIAPWDHHPIARGHRMLADAVYDALLPHLPVD